MTIHEHAWEIFVLTKNHCYIIYSKEENASNTCPPERNELFKQRNGNQSFRENMDFDLQITYQIHYFYEHIF